MVETRTWAWSTRCRSLNCRWPLRGRLATSRTTNQGSTTTSPSSSTPRGPAAQAATGQTTTRRRYSEGNNSVLPLHSGASPRSWYFVECVLENCPGWWADTVATYCPRRPPQLIKKNMTNKNITNECMYAPDCKFHKKVPWTFHLSINARMDLQCHCQVKEMR